jgi:hypothetical protein
MAASWMQLLSVPVQESWIKLLRIQAEDGSAQYDECQSLWSAIVQVSGCENTEKKIVLRNNDTTEMINRK